MSSREELRAVHNLGSTAWWRADVREARRRFEEAARLGERFGAGQMGRASAAVWCSTLCFTGAWDEALALADELISEMEGGRANYFEYHPRTVRARIQLARGGDEALVLGDARRALEVGRSTMDVQAVVPPLGTLAFVAAELGRLDEAARIGEELVGAVQDEHPINVHRIFDACWVADRIGCREPLRRFVLGAPLDLPWRGVVLASLDAEYEQAADALAAMGHVDEGYARLLAAKRLLADGRVGEGEAQVRAALAFLRPLSAARYITRAEQLLIDAGLQVPA